MATASRRRPSAATIAAAPIAGEPRRERRPGVVVRDRHPDLFDHRPGVEARVHLHERDPRLAVAFEDRPLDRRRAAPPREQRRVDVDAAVPRPREHVGRQDQAVGGDDEHVERTGDGRRRAIPASERRRLQHGEPARHGERLDRRGLDSEPAALRTVGTGEDQRNVEPRVQDRVRARAAANAGVPAKPTRIAVRARCASRRGAASSGRAP